MKSTLAVASLLTLALLGGAAARENYFTEWRSTQRQYRALLATRAASEDERDLARRFRVEIRQVVVPDLRTVDRCVTCHLGFDDPRMTGVPQPFAAHPGPILERHDVDKFGCTVCHGGQGRATSREEAHADRGQVFWERPLVPAALIESSCGACHDPAALTTRGGSRLARGHELFGQKGCGACHRLGGRGGSLGPALDGVGDKGRHAFSFAHVEGEKTIANWHRQHLRDPQKVVPDSLMLNANLAPEEIEMLTVYLLALRRPNLTERLTPADRFEERYRELHPPARAGAELYRDYCAGCHGEGTETVIHDTLRAALPSIRNADFLAVATTEFLVQSIERGRPGTYMPAWGASGGGLTREEVRALADYLLASRTEARALDFVMAAAPDAGRGRKLFEESCAACHSVTGKGGDGPWLGGPGFQETYSDARIGHTIKYGRADTLMNPFGRNAGGDLTDEQISDVVAYLRTLR